MHSTYVSYYNYYYAMQKSAIESLAALGVVVEPTL